MINPRSSNDPELKEALLAWDSVGSCWDKSFDESMRIRTALRDTSSHQALGWAALTSGRIAAYRGNVDLSEVLLTESLGRFYLADDIYGKELAIAHLAISQIARRNLERALEFASVPLSSNVAFSDQDRALIHNCAAMCHWAREETHHAIFHLVKEFELIKSTGTFDRHYVVLGNIGAVLTVLGEWDLALTVSSRAWQLQLARKSEQKALQLGQLANIVHLNYLLGNRKTALIHAEQLFAYATHSIDPVTWMNYLCMVEAFSLSGKLERARACLDRARALSANNETTFRSTQIQIGEATLFEAQRDYRSAIRLAEQVLNQSVAVVQREAHLFAAFILSRSYSALGRSTDAMKWKSVAQGLRYEKPLGDILSNQIRLSLRIDPPSEPLTDKELACLTYSAHGQTSADIAEKLGIKTRTVNFHFTKILRKLNATNRQEAIAKAVSANLLKDL